jgi:hypothetical protein
VVTPGAILVEDESMCGWSGLDERYTLKGMPHITNIMGKPVDRGAELKNTVDGQSGVMIYIELHEEKKRQHSKEFHDMVGETCAVGMRLVKNWFGSGRTVIADSWFSSVKLLIQLADRGLHFMGLVKQNHALFPKHHLATWGEGKLDGEAPVRGDSILYSSPIDENSKMYALGYKSHKPKYILSNRGTTLPAPDLVLTRHKIKEVNGVCELDERSYSIKVPQMVHMFFEYFNAVDSHNQLRQGSLAMERNWLTHTWWHRVFATILGITVVDAYKAYKHEFNQRGSLLEEPVTFLEFVDQLAYSLIFNPFLDTVRTSHHKAASCSEPPSSVSHVFIHFYNMCFFDTFTF